MYKIMLVEKSANNYGSTYKWLIDSTTRKPYEAATINDLDIKVEDMLNNEGFAKNQFIIVEEITYNVSSDLA